MRTFRVIVLIAVVNLLAIPALAETQWFVNVVNATPPPTLFDPDRGVYAVAVDPFGNTVVAGNAESTTFGTFPVASCGFVAKLSANGTWLWANPLGGCVTRAAITTDTTGAVYVAFDRGFASGTTVRRYIADGTAMSWEKTSTGFLRSDAISAGAVPLTGTGYVYLSGALNAGSSASFDTRSISTTHGGVFIAKFAMADGGAANLVHFQTPIDTTVEGAFGIDVHNDGSDPSGDKVFLAGTYRGSWIRYHAHILAPIETRPEFQFSIPGLPSQAGPLPPSLPNINEQYWSPFRGFVARLDSSLNGEAALYDPTLPDLFNIGHSECGRVVRASNGDLYVAIRRITADGNVHAHVARVPSDFSGWTKVVPVAEASADDPRFPLYLNDRNEPLDVAVDLSGSVYSSGVYEGGRKRITKFTRELTQQSLLTLTHSQAAPPRLAVSAGGDVVVAGGFWAFVVAGTATFSGGGAADVSVNVPGNAHRVYVARLSTFMRVGEEVPRPAGTAAEPPGVVLLDGYPGCTDANSFYWHPDSQKLYAVCPVSAKLDWRVLNSSSRMQAYPPRALWPVSPQRHIANAPVSLARSTAGRTFSSVLYTEAQATAGNDEARTFNAAGSGHSVLLFNGITPPLLVTRTVPWNDPSAFPASSDNRPCTIGTPLTDASHNEPGYNGYVYFVKSRQDGEGSDAAYNRTTRAGAIIPVNTDTTAADDDMVVVWYTAESATGTRWPTKPMRYTCTWPPNPAQIVIANQLGSEYNNQPKLDPAVFKDMRIYHQPDRTKAGFNPNEEHALLARSRDVNAPFQVLYALRTDLGAGSSQPYVLLKYDDASGNPLFKIYQVSLGASANTISFEADAGQKIAPPYPLATLANCPQTTITAGEALFVDVKGQPWAKAAGTGTASYYYPLQTGFTYDRNGDGGNDVSDGTCIAWFPADANPVITVKYTAVWPLSAPVLRVGQTLTGTVSGLPDIRGQASAEIVYDDANPDLTSAQHTLATLFDPVTPVAVPLDALPSGIATSNEGPELAFDSLSPDLRSRFRYDPVQKKLSFKGIYDGSLVGDPLLLPNVMTPRERDAILQLSQVTAFQEGVQSLYRKSRNPRDVDIDGNGTPDDALLIGFEKVGSSGFRRLRTLGTGAALTAGRPSDAKWTLASAVAVEFQPQRVNDGDTATEAVAWIVAGDSSVVVEFGVARAIRQFEVSAISFASDPLFDFSDNGSAWTAAGGVTSTASGFGTVTTRTYTFSSSGLHRFWRVRKPGTGSENTVITEIVPREFPGPRYSGTWTATNLNQFSAAQVNNGNAATTCFDWNVSGASSVTIDLASAKSIRQFDVSTTSFVTAPLFAWSDNSTAWTTVTPEAMTAVGFGSVTTRSYRLPAAGSHRYWRMSKSSSAAEAATFTEVWPRESADAAPGTGYVTLAVNNHPSLPNLPVELYVIRVDCDPYLGQINVFEPPNVFDDKLTLRHSGDFGGDPSNLTFEWYVHDLPPPGQQLVPPGLRADYSIDPAHANGWAPFASGKGMNSITIQGENVRTLSDNYFFVRYSGYPFCSNTTRPTAFAGAPGGSAADQRPQLAEGWIKRVVTGLNPFEARVTDFHKSPTATYASMLQVAGERYEGDIALNADAANINSLGLIQAYETVLRKGASLSINASTPVNYAPANNQLLLAASRISDFYMLLGNEAFADAADPTIGFGTQSGQYGSLAPSIFAFQNQLSSLLDEELTLLRGRDDTGAAVSARPFYNRLLWNFTTAEGELAYAQNYGIKDMNNDGLVNAADARIMFPQSHGDAWGHYLTALTTYYRLLRNNNFTWVPRSEDVTVLGAPVQVDFFDERGFATAAAALARTGSQLVDLSYRRNYVEDPAGQWQGYGDSVPSRAWGVIEWARRGGQAAYFNWAVANSLFPDVDPKSCVALNLSPGSTIPGSNPPERCHDGLTRIDRTTVAELGEIVSHADEIQAQIDQADAGLNPLGVAKNSVPFDIDPSLIASGKTHFEQVFDRAFSALTNTITVWDYVNQLSQSLRKNQDTLAGFTTNVQQRERDLNNRLIELFGYPYSDDIGPGKTYPAGYQEADIYHYMYVDLPELTGGTGPETTTFTGYYKPIPNIGDVIGSLNSDSLQVKQVTYHVALPTQNLGSTLFAGLFVKPASWTGTRRAPGEIQQALSDLIQARVRYVKTIQNYDDLIGQIQAQANEISAQSDRSAETLLVYSHQINVTRSLNSRIRDMTATSLALKRTSETVQAVAAALVEGVPKVEGVLVFDALSGIRGALLGASIVVTQGLNAAADGLDGQVSSDGLAKEEAALTSSIEIERMHQQAAIDTAIGQLEALVRQEPGARLEAIALREAMNQSVGRYLATVASGLRVLDDLAAFRKNTAASIQQYRYQDMTFRVFRNDALQKYRAQFDLAARYTYLAAAAYDYETNLLGSATASGQSFLTSIVRHRGAGQVSNGAPIAGSRGLADPLARMQQNFAVLKGQMGFNNPQTETNRFSLRTELFRLLPASDAAWRQQLQSHVVSNLWDIPEFRRYCRPFAVESNGAQPGLVIPLNTTVTSGQNFFGMPLVGGDSAYDASHFATKIRSAGVWFSNYNGTGLSNTPRIYLVPVGADTMRSPSGNLAIREWNVLDQKIPVPFPTGAVDLANPNWIPIDDGLTDTFNDIRRYSSFRAYHDSGSFSSSETTTDTRLIGRSVWNTRWLLIIPGATFLQSPSEGLQTLIEGPLLPDGTRAHNGISDIKIFFQTYAYSGN